MRRSGLGVAVVAALAVAALAGAPARGATPAKGKLSAASPKVTWKGSATVANPAGCPTASDPSCDHFQLVIEPVAGHDVKIVIDVAQGSDWDVDVYDPDGKLVAEGQDGAQSEDEVAVVKAPRKGTYVVDVQPWLVTPGATYKGMATFVAGSGGGAGGGGGGETIDSETPCGEDLPAEMSPGLTEDDGKKIKLSVLLLLDGVDTKVATAAARAAVKAYGRHGITFSVDAMRAVAFKPDSGTNEARASRLIDESRAAVGGERPKGFDVVFTLTSKDIYEDVIGNSVVGLADCIGGVRFPERAFAVGEVFDEESYISGLRLYVDVTGKILAHEIGHLLGAKHEYANCAEGIEASDVSGKGVDVSPCSLMSNFVDFQSTKFDVLNGAIVRGHASSDARP